MPRTGSSTLDFSVLSCFVVQVESRDTLNSIALKFDTTPNELVQLNKLFSRAVVPGQVLYVPDPEYVSSVGSSPSLSPISPLSPTSSEADLEKVTVC
ncbi:oxidation resistance protein 1 [Xenotaenia resolanae]|uniref:Oxidation resistance protein 1 n=1 Tax=Xenotaenia resolanae TaxID=208358 RepID=A0ABV0W1X9_9TELE